MRGIVIILAIIIVVLCLYAHYRGETQTRRRASQSIQESIGTYDNAAKSALAEYSRIHNKKSIDHFNISRIIRHNALENTRAVEELAAAADAHYAAALAGIPQDYGRGDITDAELIFILNDIDNYQVAEPLREEAGAIRINAAREKKMRKKRAAKGARASEVVAAVLDDAIVHTNDPQNVHDGGVNAGLRAILSRLGGERPAAKDLPAMIEQLPKEKRARAAAAYDKMMAGGIVSALGTTEDVVLERVWARCDDPRNAASRELMREAVVNSLADCVEKGHVVCANGRVARVLSAHTTLDYDPVVSAGVMTLEAQRNDIFEKIKVVISDTLEKSRKDMPDLVQKYEDGEDSGQFADRLRGAIEQTITDYQSSHQLRDEDAKTIKNEALTYALL